jgi:hypothetical protein
MKPFSFSLMSNHPGSLFQLSFTLFCLWPCSEICTQTKWTATPDKPGTWHYQYYTEKGTGGFRSEANYQLTAAQLTQFKQKLEAIAEVLHQNPVTKNPIGYEATVQGSIYTNWGTRLKIDLKELGKRNVEGEISLQFCPLSESDGKQGKNCMEVARCLVMINSIDATARGLVRLMETNDINKMDARDKLGMVFTLPEKVKEFAPGVVGYATGKVVVARPDKPYWVPITVGELFDLNIAACKENAKKDDNTIMLDMMVQDKAGFTPEQLQMPAYAGPNVAQIGCEENAFKYVKLNLDYFDKSLPRTAVQIFTLQVYDEALYEKNEYRFPNAAAIDGKRFFEFTKALDGEKLRTLLDVGH